MATESLKVLEEGIAAWNRRDFDAVMERIREDVHWITGGAFPGLEPAYEGREGVLRFFSDFVEPWETISTEIEEVLEESEARILLRVRFQAEGRQGIDVDAAFFQLYEFDDDHKIIWFQAFTEADEAEARRIADERSS
jgi:ketosteroid isomerase-like protein